jgi:hypothetical protein
MRSAVMVREPVYPSGNRHFRRGFLELFHDVGEVYEFTAGPSLRILASDRKWRLIGHIDIDRPCRL